MVRIINVLKFNFASLNVRFTGGLGNQLFQFVALHDLIRLDYLNMRKVNLYFTKNQSRSFEIKSHLDHCLHFKYALKTRLSFRFRLAGFMYFHFPHKKFKYLSKFACEYSDFSQNKIRFMSGNFQNLDFATDSFYEVLKELIYLITFRIKQIQSRFNLPQNYICLHVRRGDYPISNSMSDYIGQLADEFFLKNLPKHDLPVVLLTENLSDVIDLIESLKPNFVFTQKELSAWDTLAIMANSTSLICSNSTLSWWGAALCRSQYGEVMFPMNYSQWDSYDVPKLPFEDIFYIDSIWRAQV